MKAIALLASQNDGVTSWIGQVRMKVYEEVDKAIAEDEISSETIGIHTSSATKLVAEAMENLLNWHAGKIDSEWFSAQQVQRTD
ncbi:hypothetical protein [Zhihengliuella sp.]|uniref:hypothetical protein n=1 Tax=Zhihengliuella sp. TaxID=1954483 RepID=UPI00281217D9|nr:hypothetical protein [Zhihengliuella sp.]